MKSDSSNLRVEKKNLDKGQEEGISREDQDMTTAGASRIGSEI